MLSYATIQRKARTLNLAFGTHYSAREIYDRQKAAEARGQTTYDYEMLKNIQTTRADVRVKNINEVGGKYFLHATWDSLAQRSPQVAALLNGRVGIDYIDANGRVWEPVETSAGKVWREKLTGTTLTTQAGRLYPPNSVPYQVRAAHNAIKEIARRIDTAAGGAPADAYEYTDLSE